MPKKAIVPEVVPAEPTHPDLALTTTEGGSIGAFIRNLTAFFTRATELERASNDALAVAKTWKQPTDGASDVALVEKVRALATTRRDVDEHWQITAVVSRFHRRLTAARDRALKPLEEATTIGNRLHNAYAIEETRRARMEEERRRFEAEQRARLDREAELAKLEAEALKAEKASPSLSEREQRFVDLYCGPGNLTPYEAARKAGYRTDKAATDLMTLPKVRQAIDDHRRALALREQAAATRQAPVETTHEPVKAEIATAGVTRYSANVANPEAFLAAAMDPLTRTRLGIPADVLMVNDTKMNEYARSLHEQIERWPGVQLVKKTSIR